MLYLRLGVIIKQLRYCYFFTLAFAFTILYCALRFSPDDDLVVFESGNFLEWFFSPDGHVHNLEIQGIVFFVIVMRINDGSTILGLNFSTLLKFAVFTL